MISNELITIIDQIDPDFPDDFKGDIRLVLKILVEEANNSNKAITSIQSVNDQLSIDNEGLKEQIEKLERKVYNLGGSN